jgi:hypothetical protein
MRKIIQVIMRKIKLPILLGKKNYLSENQLIIDFKFIIGVVRMLLLVFDQVQKLGLIYLLLMENIHYQ